MLKQALSQGGGIPEVAGTLMARDKKGVNTFDMEEGKYAICFEPRSPDGHARVVGDIAPTLNTMGGGQREPCVTYSTPAIGHIVESDVSSCLTKNSGAGGETQNAAFVVQPTYSIRDDVTPKFYDEMTGTLGARDFKGPQCVATQYAVRRLTPIECERLMGFPDNYTNIPWSAAKEAIRKGISYEAILALRGMTLRGPNIEDCPDGPRYKALGNSWAVPVVRWIAERIDNAVN
jgi:DNA (cytosine-5)-methyltransferase 1